MVCTPETEEVEGLEEFDAKSAAVYVTGCYYSEKQEVLSKGRCRHFTRGNWLMKAMLGAVSAKVGAWAEKSKASPSLKGSTEGCRRSAIRSVDVTG